MSISSIFQHAGPDFSTFSFDVIDTIRTKKEQIRRTFTDKEHQKFIFGFYCSCYSIRLLRLAFEIVKWEQIWDSLCVFRGVDFSFFLARTRRNLTYQNVFIKIIFTTQRTHRKVLHRCTGEAFLSDQYSVKTNKWREKGGSVCKHRNSHRISIMIDIKKCDLWFIRARSCLRFASKWKHQLNNWFFLPRVKHHACHFRKWNDGKPLWILIARFLIYFPRRRFWARKNP